MKTLIALYQKGDFPTVIAQGEKLAKAAPKAFGIWNILGASYAQTGKFPKAKKAFERAVKLRPNHPDPHNNLGNVLKELGDAQAALLAYKKALSVDPKYAKAYNNVGALLTSRGKLDDAEKYLSRALKLEPAYAEAQSNLGNVFLARGALEDARAAYQKAIKSNPRYAEAHYNLGVIAQEQGDDVAAEASYMQAIKLRPNYVQALRNLGVSLKGRRLFDKARVVTERALQFAPRHLETLVNLGLILSEGGDHADAITAFDRALAVDPDHMPAILGKADALQEYGQMSQGIALLQEARKRFPDALEPLANLGLMLQRQGKPEAALELYAKAFETHPGATALFQNEALARAEMGDHRSAIVSLVAALEADPQNDTAARSLAALPNGLLDDAVIVRLRESLDQMKSSNGLPSSRHFFAADILRHEGDLDGAFAQLVLANQAKTQESALDQRRLERELRDLTTELTSWVPAPVADHHAEVTPIFIFGTSRAGKSLLEGLLAQSPSVSPQFEAIRALADGDTALALEQVFYVTSEELAGRGKRIVTSTNPHSLTQITKLADRLPNATFLFMRRDRFDIGAEMFASNYARGNEYAYDPKTILDYISAYDSLVDGLVEKLGSRALLVQFEEILDSPAQLLDRISKMSGARLDQATDAQAPSSVSRHSRFRTQFKAHYDSLS